MKPGGVLDISLGGEVRRGPLYPYTLIPLYPLYREKHTLAGRTSPLSPYKGVPPPPPRGMKLL